ncbi:MAG: hypothetical protein MN733_42575 [Nitrososphaera sp.]|nr:hypothetical protein [Nitrososphaera sp.]
MQQKSDKENLKWAQRMAYRTRDPLWWCNLAAFYATGTGCRPDSKRSRRWYAKAARVQDPRGMYELGFMFLEGEGGAKNTGRAEALLRASAQCGDLDAAKFLEYCYSTGAYGFARSKARAKLYGALSVETSVNATANNSLQRTRPKVREEKFAPTARSRSFSIGKKQTC